MISQNRRLTMKDNQAKYPQLRFKGFTDPWEQRKLGELNDVRDGTHDSPKYVVNGHPFVTSKNLSDQGLDLSDVSYISDEDFAAFNKRSKVDVGDILFGMIGTIGHPVLVESDSFAIKNVALIKGGGKISNCYLLQLLKSPVFDRYVKRENAGGTQKFLGLNLVRDFVLRVPNDDEQRKIGTFFAYLDNLIAVNQRKLTKLKELKQGYLQKLFPKNGSKFPQLRFAGFADAWEQRKLGEVATFLNGRAYKQDELLDSGKYKVLRVGNFYTNDSWYYSNMELGDKYYVDKGDLVYTWSATFGPHIWSGEKVIYHYHIWKVELSKFLDRNFTLQLLEADKARLLSSTNGSTMIHVTKGDMESKIVSIPNIDEQKQIGSFFKQLDNTITLHQRKLEKLQELKKGYLQKMFC
ncbi:type I restriction enzyme specificity protein [Secundilactobacillus collinoides DSM 20515 = JCM 1123]|uniref:Type I restriction enzyme specificity protein n=2 Tax=Secundilactobacillus collinoides TaxID=33960 RepID=A0A0R2BE97_SECCO|nr:type I restriction enzyme specificity protein [Secundilactobacillus collinoides DSM 20515 = JCM 1123]